jgi:hypothetical protein
VVITQKIVPSILLLIFLAVTVHAANTNTNTPAPPVPQGVATNTNSIPLYSDAQLQAAAQHVWRTLILVGSLMTLGGMAVAGFAFYGAYKAFGVKGVVGVGIVIVIIIFALGGWLLEAY